MHRTITFLSTIFLALIGCATESSIGVSFLKPEDILINGYNRKELFLEKLGKPFTSEKFATNQRVVEKMTYLHIGILEKTARIRVLDLFFEKDTLVGHTYMSSGYEDDTNFDELKVEKIEKDKMKYGEVIKLMGLPNGNYIFPMTETRKQTEISYNYIKQSEKFWLKFDRKYLAIVFDSIGIVRKVKFELQQDIEY